MELKAIQKNDFIALLSELAKGEQTEVIAPVRRDDIVRFRAIRSGEEADFSEWNTKLSVKEVFFPPKECLYTYAAESGSIAVAPPAPDTRRRVVVGVRPCDARSIAILDRVFASGEMKDNYYLDKRERTTIVGMACLEPLQTCFCSSVGGSPFGEEGMDALLCDMGDCYMAKAITEKGEKLIADWEVASSEDAAAMEKAQAQAEAKVRPDAVPEGVKEILDKCFEDKFWDGVHERCLGCATCTFLCPTCHCFDLAEEVAAGKGRRLRVWDTCMFPLFTRHASGANPRPSGKERMRQRVMHKFRYFVENFGVAACVGCGRCVIACPVNLDIREVLNDVAKLEPSPKT
ncbi:MAG: 4Fe-4S dicluster domain-containing protein [Planctomycetota bacterium]